MGLLLWDIIFKFIKYPQVFFCLYIFEFFNYVSILLPIKKYSYLYADTYREQKLEEEAEIFNKKLPGSQGNRLVSYMMKINCVLSVLLL